MRFAKWFARKNTFLPIIALVSCLFMLYIYCGSVNESTNNKKGLENTKKELNSLRYVVDTLHGRFSNSVNTYFDRKKLHSLFGSYLNISSLPKIFLITPTYTRYTQQADLVRLGNTLKLIPNIHWILVEDSEIKTNLVSNFLQESGLVYTHLNVKTQKDLLMKHNDPRWKKHRGVDQRNHALFWIRKNIDRKTNGVVYFADDDNTYHTKLFDEMRFTKTVSMWPVGLVGGLKWEGPVCENNKVIDFWTVWEKSRAFPVDMAAFAINMKYLYDYPENFIDPESKRGYLETNFLQRFKITKELLEAKAENCSKILVWHTQTADAKMKQEIRLKKEGRQGSNPKLIV